jgi:phosphoserine phosphatase RsbU/P
MKLASISRPLFNEFRTRRMARYTLWVLVYGVVVATADLIGGKLPEVWWLIFWANLAVAGVYYFLRLVGFVRHRLLWPVLRRLVVTYLFIGLIPILLILSLVAMGALVINGQFAAFLVEQRLRSRVDELAQLNRLVLPEVQRATDKNPQALFERVEKFFATELKAGQESYPGLEITLRLGTEARAFRLNGQPLKQPVSVPSWLKPEAFAGFAVDGDQLCLRAVEQGETPAGVLTMILSQPLTPDLLDQAGRGIGPVGVYFLVVQNTAGPGRDLSVLSKTAELPPPMNLLDQTVSGRSAINFTLWSPASETRQEGHVTVLATARLLSLNRQLLATIRELSSAYVTGFEALALVFLLLGAFGLVIGWRLTRSITATVDRLNVATERVKSGDFSYRTNIRAEDQLSSLGQAFDSMTASVERLLREAEEKSRLESELEIAREVQKALFPGKFPEIVGLRVFGVCKPARSVSGDYFDFQPLSGDRLALVLGDVSGKGISAALLMAAIQASLRAQFYDGRTISPAASDSVISTADIVERLNRQLLDSTTAEKYTTFFYGIYDARSRTLTYTNAGHLAPALFRRDRILRLDCGGTVVGLFRGMKYDQEKIQLEPGDVLLGFTDGLTEPENSFGEEIGEERLFGAARRALSGSPDLIAQEIYHEVDDWTGSPELQDDQTMIIAQAMA